MELEAWATFGRFDSGHDHPAVVGAGMSRTVDIVNAGGPRAVRNVALSIGEDGVVDLRGHHAVEIIIGDDLHVDGTSGGQRNGDSGDVVIAVTAAVLQPGSLYHCAANHDVVDVASGA